jgi:hypothetical protein
MSHQPFTGHSMATAQTNPRRNISRVFTLNRDTTRRQFSGIPNNEVRLAFATPQSFKDCEVALVKASIYKSWFNITEAIGNNTFSYKIPDNAAVPSSYIEVFMTLPDGIYSIPDINASLHADMKSRGYYFQADSGTIPLPDIYPIEIVADPITYRVSIKTLPLFPAPDDPTQVPPTSHYVWTADPVTTVPYHAGIIISSSIFGSGANAGGFDIFHSSMGRVLGFSPGTYPPNATDDDTQVTSTGTFIPEITLQNQILFQCNLANEISNNSYAQLLSQYIPTGSSGEPLEFQDQNLSYHQMNDGLVPYISVVVTDEHNIPLIVQDPVMSVTVHVREIVPRST